jgi:hypothetical protein
VRFYPNVQIPEVLHWDKIVYESFSGVTRQLATAGWRMVMKEFVDKYRDRIHGVLNCLDRMLFRGYLPIMSGWAMAEFLNSLDLKFRNLKPFLMENAQRVKDHALAMATKHNRPYVYLQGKMRMEDAAKGWPSGRESPRGWSVSSRFVQPCRSFAFRFEKGRPFVQSAKRKCLHLYFYFIDREFGLIHVPLQTWFPMQIQVYLNGHEWLARKLAASRIGYAKLDNAFTWIEDLDRAQRFANRFRVWTGRPFWTSMPDRLFHN